MSKVFFPETKNLEPKVYAYADSHAQYEDLLKIGYTTQDVIDRVKQQYPILTPGEPTYTIILDEPAVRNDGSTFTDKDVHRYLRTKGFLNPVGEWFKCNIDDIRSALHVLKTGKINEGGRSNNFEMRPEQQAAIEKTARYFESFSDDENDTIPHFLWNAKMRFGKTFASYQLAKRMKWKKVLVLTFKPAVQSAWQEDLATHTDFVDWQFIHSDGVPYEKADLSKHLVCFGSFQDYLGKNSAGGIKAKNEWVHTTHWDCVIFDEYHYGAWRESAKELFEAEDKRELTEQEGEGIEFFDEEILPITTNHYLYLSGTPFRAIESGEFIEEQIFNWTYSDEQKAKENWKNGENPYAPLPRMVLLTYRMPDSIREVALEGEFDEFDLNLFFSATGKEREAKFIYENEVQKWLDLIRGQYLETTTDNLKLGAKKPPLPYSDARLLKILNHTFWFLPTVAACHAMKNLLHQNQNIFFHGYKIIVAAGNKAGLGVKALEPVKLAMDNPLKTKTITLSCGKLTTGVSVKPWTGILMLRNSSSPETYFQAAFRVQTPWVVHNPDGISPNKKEIIKNECYVFDFAPNRALRQISDYSCRLNVTDTNPEQKVAEFIKFLPVLAYDGSSMEQMDAAKILDMAMSGTSATLLARRWESALLVNVDNSTLSRLMKNERAMQALMNIEGFRSLNSDIETIINKSDSVKKAKEKANEKDLTKKEKRQLSEEEKEYKSLRKKIQEKLIKFATRIPVFMYLTDFRERSLKDVITQLEPGLFQKVTGLSVDDFDLLVSLNVFNSSLMNDAVYKFKRYEDASLGYTGINKNEGEDVGLFDTIISREEFIQQNQ
ncbi:GIY-YIG nuclease family protein [Planktomarina temperata]|nr:GIY-YIG nuclease family protein [Planktomarina temperata]